ncbi:MAG: TldD/PmbA family protein [Candidatus Zixiibacteriota bacterium]
MQKDRILGTLQKGLKFSRAEQTELLWLEEDFNYTGFMQNTVFNNISRYDHVLMARTVLDKKIGVAVSNRIDEENLKKMIKESFEIAQNQQEDPDFVSLPRSLPAPEVKGYYEETSEFSPTDRAKAVEKIVKDSEREKLNSFGAFETKTDIIGVVNSLGTQQFFKGTQSHLTLTASSNGASGWAQDFQREVNRIDVQNVAQTAIRKAIMSQNPVELPPGEYTVILEEASVASLLLFLGFLGFGGKTFSQGRSFMSNKIGERITGENITVTEDPFDPEMIGIPFDYEGVTKKKVVLVENGLARGVVYNSYYANKFGIQSTGHALKPDNPFGPYPKNMVMAIGNSNMEEMISSTDYGILVTRLWYINYLNPMRTMVTGTTRDGTFLIEKGKITRAVKNMRIGQSILEAFSNVELIANTRKVCPQFGVVMLVPAMKISKFNFIEQ